MFIISNLGQFFADRAFVLLGNVHTQHISRNLNRSMRNKTCVEVFTVFNISKSVMISPASAIEISQGLLTAHALDWTEMTRNTSTQLHDAFIGHGVSVMT